MTFLPKAHATLVGLMAVGLSMATAAQAHDIRPYQVPNEYHQDAYAGPGRDDRMGDRDIQIRLSRLDRRLEIGLQEGRLTRDESHYLSRDLYQLSRLSRSYSYNGLSRWEYADLSQRIDRLEHQVARESHDDDRRSFGYGYGQGGSWGSPRGW
jgi:hypothetical protein